MRVQTFVLPYSGGSASVTWDDLTITWNESTGTWNAPDVPEIAYKVGSLYIDRSTDGRISTCEIVVGPLQRGVSWCIPACGDTLYVRDADSGDYLFLGKITKVEPRLLRGSYIELSLAAQDYSYLMDGVVVEESYTATSDATVIADLLNTYMPAITPTYVMPITDITITFTGVSLRAALNKICEQTGGYWYVDPLLRLHYEVPGTSAVSFSLVERENANYTTTFPYLRNPAYSEDFTQACNLCTVYGQVAEGGTQVDGYAQDAASQATYGVFSKVLVDRTLVDATACTNRAQVEVARYANPISAGSIVFDHDGADVGKTIAITCASHGLTAASRVIRRLQFHQIKTNLDGTSLFHYTAEFGDFQPNLVWALQRMYQATQPSAELPTAVPVEGSVDETSVELPGDIQRTDDEFDGSIVVSSVAAAASGAQRIGMAVTYGPPDTLGSFRGVIPEIVKPDGTHIVCSRHDYLAVHPANMTIYLGPFETSAASENWTVYLRKYSDLWTETLDTGAGGTARRTATVTPTAGLDGTKVSPGTIQTASFASTIRPVTLYAGEPTLPSSTYPAGSMLYDTTTSPRTLKKVNTAGTAWEKMINGGTDIQAGTVTANEIYANTITAGQIAAGAIGTTQLYAGEILVGGGGGKPTRFRVNDAYGSLVSFIGDNGAGFIGIYGIYARFGPDINNPVISCGATGVTINGAPLTLTLNGVETKVTNEYDTYGYAGLRVKFSANTGRSFVGPGFASFWSITGTESIYLVAGAAGYGQLWMYNAGATKILLNAETGKVWSAAEMDTLSYKVNAIQVINSSRQYCGYGVDVGTYGVRCRAINPLDSGGNQQYGQDTSAAFFTGLTLLTKTIGLRKTYSGGYLSDVTLTVDGFDAATVVLGYSFTPTVGLMVFTGGVLTYKV